MIQDKLAGKRLQPASAFVIYSSVSFYYFDTSIILPLFADLLWATSIPGRRTRKLARPSTAGLDNHQVSGGRDITFVAEQSPRRNVSH
jgi:hypothetical protein